MNKKSLWAVVGLLLIVVVVVVALAYNKKDAVPVATTAAPTYQPMSNNAPGAPFFGTLVSSTPTSVTAKGQDGTTKTFTITAQTPVISTVKAGEVAGTLASAQPGAHIVVMFDKANPTTIANIQLLAAPAAPPTVPTGSTMVTLAGVVVSHSANSLVITKQTDGTKATIALSKNTQIISNASAGKTGKTLSYLTDNNSYVSVQAIQTGTTYTAFAVQILIPLDALMQ